MTAGGVTLGTLLILFIVPTIYALLGRFQDAPGALAARLREEEKQADRR